MSIKKQSDWSPQKYIGRSKIIRLDPVYTIWNYPRMKTMMQETASWSHKRNSKGIWKDGGPFLTRKVKVEHSPVFGHYDQGGTATIRRECDCLFYVDNLGADALALPSFQSVGTLYALGTKGIARFSPTTPQAGFAQSIAELRQVPRIPDVRALKERARELFKNTPRNRRSKSILNQVGDEYLNYVFGWVPFYRDLCDLYDGLKNHQKKVDQLRRNSGKHVRRGGTLIKDSTSTSTIVTEGHMGYPAFVSQYYTTSQTVRTTTDTSNTNGWFRGAFTYFLPDATGTDASFRDNVREKLAIARILYGLDVTPATLWELTPWSWLADWAGNIGDNVRNFSNFINDGLVLHYGFAMLHVESKTVTSRAIPLKSGVITPVKTTVSYTKQRETASPYGFGWNPSSATARQGAILAALAASKA